MASKPAGRPAWWLFKLQRAKKRPELPTLLFLWTVWAPDSRLRQEQPWSSGKRQSAIPDGHRIAENDTQQSHQCNGCRTVQGNDRVFWQRKGRKAVKYCSKACQTKHWKEHKVLCKAIRHLDTNKKELEAAHSGHFVTHLNPKQRTTLERLVGRKCIVKCYLNDQPVEVLWDTGAKVSIIPENLLKRILPGVTIKDISELVGVELNLTAANGTTIPYKRWVDLKFRLSSPEPHWLGRT